MMFLINYLLEYYGIFIYTFVRILNVQDYTIFKSSIHVNWSLKFVVQIKFIEPVESVV